MTSCPEKFAIKTLALKLSCATSALILAATQVHAQSIDYSSFEDLFGEPITVGATGTPKRASEVPVNMTIITADQIRHSGSRDIPEILRTLVGLDVQRATQTNANVAIRGMNIDGGRLRVLINGRDTFRTYEGVTQWAALPVSMAEIRQIEVVRGPSTSLYGANAVTGVVNIITFNPLNESVSNVTVRAGTLGILEASAVATFQLEDGKGGVRFSASHFEADQFNTPISATDALLRDDPENDKFSLDGLFQLSDSIQWGAEVTYYKGVIGTVEPNGRGQYGTTEDYSMKTTLSVDTSSGKWNLAMHQNANEEGRLSVVLLESGPLLLNNTIKAKSLFVELSNFRSIGAKTAVRFSAGYKDDKVDQFGLGALTNTGHVGLRTFYGSALWNYAASDKLSVTTSFRWDYMNLRRTADEAAFVPFTNDDYGSFSEFSINAGLVYKVSDFDTIKAIYGRGFNAPNLFEFGGQINDAAGLLPGLRAVSGSPDARPSISQQFEIQYTKKIESIQGALNASVFVRLDDELFAAISGGRARPIPNDTDLFVAFGKLANVQTYGIEIDLSGQTDTGLNWGLKYSYANSSEDPIEDPSLGARASDVFPLNRITYADRSPKHIASALLGYESEHLWATTLLHY
ncbi:MAG: TonB-dependent receptor, partial [Kordiimonadaceae bacterium]|nr:TonB-dependent receptor [Kordiimonadaceae bacterium]